MNANARRPVRSPLTSLGRLLAAALLACLAAGCASSPQADRYVHYGQVRGDPVRIPPCNPFRADDLMDWATELGGQAYHQRTARASVDTQGWVRCRSAEAAGSRSVR